MSLSDSIEERAAAAYLGMAVGDALGATVEFMSPAEIKHQYGIHKEIIGGGWLRLTPGQVTDDTSMSLFLGESILACNETNPHNVAMAFSDWLRSKPVDIGHTVRKGIIHFRHGGIPIVPPSETDAGNGACMRTLPVALSTLYEDEVSIRMSSRNQAHTTHNNELSDAGTECVVLMVQSALLGWNKLEIEKAWVNPLIKKFPAFQYKTEKIENPTGYIVHTLQAVFQAFFNHSSFEASMIDVVNRGGDSDTTGAILGMLAGSFYGISSIPSRWLKALNKDVKIACETQAIQLIKLANSKRSVKNQSVASNARG